MNEADLVYECPRCRRILTDAEVRGMMCFLGCGNAIFTPLVPIQVLNESPRR